MDGPVPGLAPPAEDKGNRDLKWGKVGGSVVRPLEPIPERPDFDIGEDEEMKELKAQKDREWDEYLQTGTDKTIEEGQKIVKIASGADFLVALRASGEVWVCSVKDEASAHWVYVSHAF
jgi:SCF-associated factor 1